MGAYEFSYKNNTDTLSFSKNEHAPIAVVGQETPAKTSQTAVSETSPAQVEVIEESVASAEGDLIESPLVGVAYLSPGPDKAAFISVGDMVKKGQTLLIVEAMKIMNEIPAPKDGVVTEILVANEEIVEFGKGLVRIK
ncbi:acetyl-CoA carboxylase biotin carboxyl carrier protein subunit [Streptococcus sp. 19428wA2_WM07]|uniref:acetyl-CoA carboxylase biotin carboxyl carrier protein n=1 Tax=Streptococcus sp. 19428wA2_WM07 TaxID=2782468 RepID=UPI001D1612E9|nr:acetyl-CoA carboxylase biotin carboxyl carrier protein subunit [Streptococcus sp. 19428wA2_WM07]